MLAVPAKRYPSEISNQKRGKELTEMDVVLETDCSLLKGKEFYPHRVILTNSKLICRPQGTKKNRGLVEISIQLKDVLLSNHHTHLKDCGKFKHESSCMPCRFCKTSPSQINFQDGSSSALLTVICFPYSKAVQDGGVRKKKELIFLFEGDFNHTENLQLVQDWSTNINNLCNARTNDNLTRAEVGDATDHPLSSRRRKRKFLVCINPFSGPGNAKQIYSHEVKPVFQEADIEVEELVTIKQNHARDVARTVSYKDYDAVIIVSGDGLIFEWLNGIMERDDRDQAIKLPMGIIPAGSGNALATAMLVSKQEQCFKNSHLHSALLAAKGRPTPMDVVEVHYGDKKVYSFLAVAWGIISDIDIESEWLRFMGSPRFTIQAFIRIMALRKYRGILHYLPAEGYSQSSHSTQNGHVVGGGNEGESTNHNAPLVNNTSVSVQAGDGILNPSFQTSESQESHVGSSESDSPTTQQPLLPPLSEPVPSNWVKVEGKFVCIVVLQDSHLSRDIIAWPNRAFNEGVMCIQYVMYPVSRRHLLDLMGEMEKGDHMEKNSVTSVFVKAFRIEPLEEDGIVTVDGEKVEFGPIQGQMMEMKANILIPS